MSKIWLYFDKNISASGDQTSPPDRFARTSPLDATIGTFNPKSPIPSGPYGGMGWGLSPQKCRFVPTVKRTGQESGGEMCEIVSAVKFCKTVL